MGQDKLELLVQNKIGDYQSPIDTDSLWAGINNGAAVATTTKAAVLGTSAKWMIGSVLVLSMVAVGIYCLSSSSEGQTAYVAPIQEAKESPSVTSVKNDALVPNAEKETVTNLLMTSEVAENVVNLPVQESIPSVQAISVEQNTSSAKVLKSQEIETSSTSRTDNNNNNTGKTTTAIDFSQDAATNKASTKEIARSNTSTRIEGEVLANSSVLINKQNRNLLSDFSINNSGIGLLDANYGLGNNIENPKKVVCPSFGGTRGGTGSFGFELQAIPFYSIKQFKALDALGEEWQATRESTESYLESFQINALLRYQHSSGFYAHGGIGYGQIDEKVQLNTADMMDITVDTVTIIILHPDGSIDTIRGPVMGTSETELDATVYNYHRMIELPFAIGYEVPLSNRIGLYGDFGGSLNLAVFRTGYTVVDRTDIVPFDSTSRPVYKTSTGFKIKGSLGLRYYTDSGITLSAGPEIRYHTGNWLRSELTLEQRYLDIGMRLAVGYNF